jgi:hypothetical protein
LIFCSNLPWIANVYQKDWLVGHKFNTGLGNKKDAFVHKDFPALLQILDKVTKTVTESRQNLDEEQTALKCVEESTDNKLVITRSMQIDFERVSYSHLSGLSTQIT